MIDQGIYNHDETGYTRERDKEWNESPSCEGCMGEDKENRGNQKLIETSSQVSA